MMSNKTPELNIDKTIRFLTKTFRAAEEEYSHSIGLPTEWLITFPYKQNCKAPLLRKYQEEFAYLIDALKRGPVSLTDQVNNDCNILIDNLLQERPIPYNSELDERC